MSRKEIIAVLAELLVKLRPGLVLDVETLDENISLRDDLGIDSITLFALRHSFRNAQPR